MPKYSYKSSELQSSVVILKDGSAMEVRRGEDTRFAEGERRLWGSLEEWKATLPVGAVVADIQSPVKPMVSPVIAHILAHAGKKTIYEVLGWEMQHGK